MSVFLIGICFLVSAVPSSAQQTDEVLLGEVEPGTIVSFEIVVANETDAPITYTFASGCSCVQPMSARVDVDPGTFGFVTFTFNATGYQGPVSRSVLVSSSAPKQEPRKVPIRAYVKAGNTRSDAEPCPVCPSDDERAPTGAARNLITVHYYADSRCPLCVEFLEHTVPSIRDDVSTPFVVVEHDINDDRSMAHLLSQEPVAHIRLEKFPVVVVGNTVLQGLNAIEAGLAAAVDRAATGPKQADRAEAASPAPAEDSSAAAARAVSVGAIVLAGLADGVNPCAFSSLLFLISMLALVGRTKNQLLIVGLVFTVTVFAAYYAAGLGLFASVRALSVFPTVVSAIRWVLIALLAVLAALSFRDAILAARGRTDQMALQLSTKMKRRIHWVVRTRVRTASIITGTVVLALLVTVFEFSCTGQVYLPIVMHLARTEASRRALGLLAVYNLAFIAPLIVVFGVSYAGVTLDSVSALFSRNIPLVKTLLGLVFAGLAVMTVLY